MEYLEGYIRTSPLSFKIVSEEQRIIEGYASTKDIDRVKDVILPEAFRKTVREYLAGTHSLLFNHNPNQVVGKVVGAKIDDIGLFVRAQVGKGYGMADDVWGMIRDDALKAFSIGYIPLKIEEDEKDPLINYIKELDLVEISLTPVPANKRALFQLANGKAIEIKMMEDDLTMDMDVQEKQVAPYRKNQPLNTELSWSKRRCISDMKKYASKSDGSISPDKYFLGFFYRDEKRKELQTAYKLGYCYVIDGKVTAIKRGIMAVAGVLQGARGGVNIPDDEKARVKSVVSKWYKRWDGTAPWDREKAYFTDEELIAILEDAYDDVYLELSADFETKLVEFQKQYDERLIELQKQYDEELALLKNQIDEVIKTYVKEQPISEPETVEPEDEKYVISLDEIKDVFKEILAEIKN